MGINSRLVRCLRVHIVDNEFSTRVNVGPNASVIPLAFSDLLSSPFICSEVVL